MLHIADTKMARRYGDFFIRQIHKLEEVIAIVVYNNVSNINLLIFTAVHKRLNYDAYNTRKKIMIHNNYYG